MIYQWLDTALFCGISEETYWNSTIAEVSRAVTAYKEREEQRRKERATFDYVLANAIGLSVGRLLSSQNSYPPIYELYPSIFEKEIMEEEIQRKRDEATAIRFKQFVQSHNKKFLKKEVETSE